MNEADERARLNVASEGLVYLLSPKGANGESVGRSRLFAIKDGNKDEAMDRAYRAKGWQKTYVERLVNLGILEKLQEGSSTKYRCASQGAVLGLIKDYIDGQNELMSKLVFPDGMSLIQLERLLVKRINLLMEYDDEHRLVTALSEEESEGEETIPDPRSEEEIDASVEHGKDLVVALVENQNNMVEGIRLIDQELLSIKAELKKVTSGNVQVVSSVQGVLRKIGEKPNGDNGVTAWAAAISRAIDDNKHRTTELAKNVEVLTGYGKVSENALTAILDRIGAINKRLDENQQNQLTTAIETLKVATEMVADALTEVKS